MEKGLNVILLKHTPEPEVLIALAAKLCYSASNIKDLLEKQSSEKARAFIDNLVSMGHESPLEHAVYTLGIEGVSRSLTHQLVRHRIASYSQQSQRYVSEHSSKNSDGIFDYITPDLVKKVKGNEEWSEDMKIFQRIYDKWLNRFEEKLGITGERAHQDARYALPNSAESKIIMTMNARSLLNFFRERTCNRAQWEIRDMAIEIYKKIYPTAPSLFRYAGPSCITDSCHEGKMSCGLADKVREEFENLRGKNEIR